MAKTVVFLLLFVSLLCTIVAPPVKENQNKENEQTNDVGGLEDYMEYHRYLREVVNALESDPDFRVKLEKAQEDDIRSGKIAEELEFVSHHVRTRLDEIKRIELERLKQLTEKKRQLENEINKEDSHGHLDHANPHTFEIEDLKKLIAKTTQDLAEADKKRRDDFKEYELKKEYDKQKKLNETAAEEREKLEKEFQEKEQKHKQHEKLHEPGHKAQLEEVWEKQDQMQQDFDPKMFFMLHDIDGNGLWDQDEVKALFVKELDKMYQAGAPEDDMRERAEEMERMRESVFKEVDLNRDGFIDYEEFLMQTRRNDFQQDHGWQGVDEQRPYTDEELAEYIRQHQMNMMAQGYPPNQAYYPNPNHPQGYPQHPQGYNQMPPQQYHPAQGIQPPQHQVQHPNLNTNEIYQGHPAQGSYQHNPAQYNQMPVQQQGGVQRPPNQQYQQPNQQYQQPNQQYQQPNQQFQQPKQQQQPNQQGNVQYQQGNGQYQQVNQPPVPSSQQNAQAQQPNPQTNQGQAPPVNQGQVPPANQAQIPQANQGQAPPVNQGQVPPANQGQLPPANQGQAPPANQGQVPPVNQGQLPHPAEIRNVNSQPDVNNPVNNNVDPEVNRV